jgi:hypothetical protein
MVKRLIFISKPQEFPFVRDLELEFKWNPGFSKIQSSKNIKLLHNEASKLGLHPTLEISSKSDIELGRLLSAFNLKLKINDHILTVESAYQGSKCFEFGGPYHDLYQVSSKEAKLDYRLKNSGNVIGYKLFNIEFPSNPKTIFYNWLYITSLYQNIELANQLKGYKSYSDIVFNNKKSINCQARAAALYVALNSNGLLKYILSDVDYYLSLYEINRKVKSKSLNLEQLELPI